MGNFSRARRAGPAAIAGRRRAQAVAERLGTGLLEARRVTGLTQKAVGERAGLSQPRYSELERGLGSGASLETWAIAASGVGEQLAAFLERAPGANRPRDTEHLRRQNTVAELTRSGGWTPMPELAIDDGRPRSRSIDLAITRLDRGEVAVVEIWDWLDDVGAAWRGLDAKKQAVTGRLGLDGSVAIGGLFVVRATRRNQSVARQFDALFGARFRGDSKAWLRALTDPDCRMPRGDGFLWSLADGRLRAARLSAA